MIEQQTSNIGPGQEEKKKKGGQPGNRNRLKHGFYSRKLPAGDVRDIHSYMFTGVQEEIDLFRLTIRQALDMAHQTKSFAECMAYFRAITYAFGQFARLVRAEHYLVINPPKSTEPTTNDLLEEAIQEVLAEMRAEEDEPANSFASSSPNISTEDLGKMPEAEGAEQTDRNQPTLEQDDSEKTLGF